MKRSQQEINEAIEVLTSLRKVMPQKSFFGDDNHITIDSQIGALSGTITNFDRYTNWDLLEDIVAWMNGEEREWLQDAKDDLKNFSVE